jgi:uncharacterized membrane protein
MCGLWLLPIQVDSGSHLAGNLVWWRKSLFQVHLWAGVIVAVYMIAISLSGSIFVISIDNGTCWLKQAETVKVQISPSCWLQQNHTGVPGNIEVYY